MYGSLKRLYLAGRITADMLEIAVSKTWITEEQKAEIIASKTATTN